MNEQLVVKNFGPIKDATVDFKRVTVFIGPTGGGKSTLAKLAAIFRGDFLTASNDLEVKSLAFRELLNHFLILDYLSSNSTLQWRGIINYFNCTSTEFEHKKNISFVGQNTWLKHQSGFQSRIEDEESPIKYLVDYVPADRAFTGALESSLAGLVLKDIALPETLLMFLNDFKRAQRNLTLFPLEVPFLNIIYKTVNSQARIILENGELIELGRGASGMQALIPLMLVIQDATKYDSTSWKRLKSIPQSFIIEEPELNLYPTAQQGLLNWLVEKCTQGENDLTITTHSPYILSHLNLLLYAYHVGNQDEEKRQKVAAIVPEKYWINPDEFSAYYVGDGGVRSLLDAETKLISQNGLDTVSGVQADEFDQLIDISRGF